MATSREGRGQASGHSDPDACLCRDATVNQEIVRQGRYVTFQMAEVAVPNGLFEEILRLIRLTPGATNSSIRRRRRVDSADRQRERCALRTRIIAISRLGRLGSGRSAAQSRRLPSRTALNIARGGDEAYCGAKNRGSSGDWGNVG
jgi:hypothetical protein